MNRRRLLKLAAATPAATQLRAQPEHRFRFRAGLVAYLYRRLLANRSTTYGDLIYKIADWGLDGLDCTVYWFPDAPNTSNEWLAALRKTAFKNGVQIYNIGVQVNLSQPTAELRTAEIEKIRKWVDVADRVGASHIRVFGGPVPQGATEEQAIAWAGETLRSGAEYSGSRGITIGVEDDAGLTITAEPTVAIIKHAASPWAVINADSGNLRVDGYSQFEMLLPYATSVHLKTLVAGADSKKRPADWNRLLDMAGRSGYKGYIGLEYEGSNPEADVPKLAADLRMLVRKVSG